MNMNLSCDSKICAIDSQSDIISIDTIFWHLTVSNYNKALNRRG